ncbi:hypothetical protein [Streptomyces catenulae]|uniref:Uncharacterized protein n=1 Tax=Streptomyces catenulae TaxID=66875 RepID=A0ABV2Z845_9ACTN|nr:hypothetical protein [Streptomyces catenulae]
MKYDVCQIIGMVAVAVCGQGAVRLLVHHGDTGVLGALHAGFGVTLGVYATGTVAGVVLAGWAHGRAKALGRRG